MTWEEFEATSVAILRSALGWQTAIARRLGVEARTVRRWRKIGIPSWAVERLMEWTALSDRLPWPRDEWIIGDGVGLDGVPRQYIVHTVPPRFIARIVETDDDFGDGEPDPAESAVDLASGVTFHAGFGAVLCEIAWIDEPRPGEVAQLLEAAADAIERMDEIDDALDASKMLSKIRDRR